jgi:hypothetical protein
MSTAARRSRATRAEHEALRAVFGQAWPKALEAWSRFTRLKPPLLCDTRAQAEREGLEGSFAMIRLVDQAIVIDLSEVHARGLGDYAVELLAHEIGHHVLAPATLSDHGRMIARMRWALPTIEHQAPLVANLYTDLLINDRLERSAELRVDHIYRLLASDAEAGATWALYLRIYEVLWNLPRGALGGGRTDDRLEGDAWLGARLVKSYARDWLDGSGRFAALFFPHLLEDDASLEAIQALLDTRSAAVGGEPSGLTEADADEKSGAIHPAQDPALSGVDGDEAAPPEAPPSPAPAGGARGQKREPFEYGDILRAAGIELSDHEVAVRYYREQALGHLIPFPRRRVPAGTDPLPEGLEPWDIGQPLDDVDWLQTVLVSPRVFPGLTTVQRLWGLSEGSAPKLEPLDLDLYVDSSGSMANPQRNVSYPALAGAILCLSALRAGARVQATLWSGKHQFDKTPGFVRDEAALLRVLTGYFGGGTAFPIHVLRDTFEARRPDDRPAHVLVISDDGVSTLFDRDERGSSGWDVARRALERARGGATFVLALPEDWEHETTQHPYWAQAFTAIRKARDELGIQVHRVASWESLIAFAREFSRRNYLPEEAR